MSPLTYSSLPWNVWSNSLSAYVQKHKSWHFLFRNLVTGAYLFLCLIFCSFYFCRGSHIKAGVFGKALVSAILSLKSKSHRAKMLSSDNFDTANRLSIIDKIYISQKLEDWRLKAQTTHLTPHRNPEFSWISQEMSHLSFKLLTKRFYYCLSPQKTSSVRVWYI